MDQSKNAPVREAARNIPTGPANSIVDTAITAGNFTTFAAAVQTAGLIGALAAKGPFTLFAPIDEALEKLPSGAYGALLEVAAKLKAALNYHVVKGYFMARDVKSGEVMTLQGSTLRAAGSVLEFEIPKPPRAEARRISVMVS
jgi:uncharacterized surface protein with fasciclin (FAS1) repeats